MNVYVQELAMSGGYHAEINSSFILMMRSIYPISNKIIFIAEKDHLEICKSKLCDKTQNVNFKSLLYFPKASLKTLLLRDFLSIFYSLKTLFYSQKKDVIFFTYLLPVSHIFICLFNLILHRKLFICIHSQTEAYVSPCNLRYTKYYFKLDKLMYKTTFFQQYIVLGESIYSEIKGMFSEKTKKIVIDHPYLYSGCNVSNNSGEDVLRVGQIGVGDSAKGTRDLFLIADMMKKEILDNKLNIEIVGRLNQALLLHDNGLVAYQRKMLSEEEFNSRILNMHITLYLRDYTKGIGVASGSFFDTVKYLKPYISLNNNYISYYNKKYPKSGIVCESIDEMVSQIRFFLHNPKLLDKWYSDAIYELKRMQCELSIQNIAESFKKQISS